MGKEFENFDKIYSKKTGRSSCHNENIGKSMEIGHHPEKDYEIDETRSPV
jgi:hypothetical protein